MVAGLLLLVLAAAEQSRVDVGSNPIETVGAVVEEEFSDAVRFGSFAFWKSCICSLLCVASAALAAGLTLGMTSLDEFNLKVLRNFKVDEVEPEAPQDVREAAQKKLLEEQQYAEKLLPVISGHLFASSGRKGHKTVPLSCNPTNGHVVLVTLLLMNAAANEALPIFLGELVPEWAAVLLSVTVVLIFGEILPSAIFTGPNQLQLAACLCPVVSFLKMTLLPIVWPISLFLDKCLGGHEEQRNRAGIKAMIRTIQQECLESDEANMIHGVLEMHHKTVETIGHPITRAAMLAHDDLLSEELLQTLRSWNHTLVFVYRRDPQDPQRQDDIIGVLKIRKLLGLNFSDRPRVDSLAEAIRTPTVLHCHDNLLNTLQRFEEHKCHLGIICPDRDAAVRAMKEQSSIPLNARPVRFCALSDVMQQLLSEVVMDDDDVKRTTSYIKRPGPQPKRSGSSSFAQGLNSLGRRPNTAFLEGDAGNTSPVSEGLSRGEEGHTGFPTSWERTSLEP